MDLLYGLFILVCFAVGLTRVQSQSTRCIDNISPAVNNSHPTKANNWTDTEQWNATALTGFCSMGSVDIRCKDGNGQDIGTVMQTSHYIVTCNTINGLMCRRNGTKYCPDFAAVYSCICPKTTAVSLVGTTVIRNTVNHFVGSTAPGRNNSKTVVIYSSGSSSSNSSQSGSSALQSTKQPNINSVSDSGHLSIGEIVGISLGGAALLAIVIAGPLLLYFWKQKHSNKIGVPFQIQTSEKQASPKADLA